MPQTKGRQTHRKKTKRKTARDRLKERIAAEIGLADKVREVGWRGLSARESGRIGGIMGGRRKARGR